MNFAEAISSGFSKYVQFGGRACRSEYWYWTLFAFIATVVANIIEATLGIGFVGAIVGLGLILPGLAVSARRLSRYRSDVLVGAAHLHDYRHARADLLGLSAWYRWPQSVRP
jgi:hypothetical protein